MIERITVQNYKCLRDVTVSLARAAVVGAARRRRGERTRSMRWVVEASAGSRRCRYELSLPIDGPPENEALELDGATALQVRGRGLLQSLDEKFVRDLGDFHPASARLQNS